MDTKEEVGFLLRRIAVETSKTWAVPNEESSQWTILSWTGVDRGWPDESLIMLCSNDVRWRIFQTAERGIVPDGAMRIDWDGLPLRFEKIGGSPVDPDEESLVDGGTASVISEKWLDAPFEAQLYVVEGPEKPVYRVKLGDNRIAVRFDPNGAKFYAVIVTRTAED